MRKLSQQFPNILDEVNMSVSGQVSAKSNHHGVNNYSRNYQQKPQLLQAAHLNQYGQSANQISALNASSGPNYQGRLRSDQNR